MKCKYCGSVHKNKTKESLYAELSDTCLKCESIKKMLNLFVESINLYTKEGEERPRRKLTIESFKIEKI